MKNWNQTLYRAAGDGDIEALELSLQNGADIDYQTVSGWTALMFAAYGGYLEICRLLIDTGCKIDITQGLFGETALMKAAYGGYLEICRLLIDTGCKINITNRYGVTALMMAANVGHLEICRLLIDRGCKIDITNGLGWTALMWAVEGGHLEICRLLIDTGCKIDITDRDGKTALHFAAARGHLQTTRYLVEQGASPLVTTDGGETPYDLAAAKKWGQYKEVMEYLQSIMPEQFSGVTAGLEKEEDIVPTEIRLMADDRSVELYLTLLESGYELKRDIRLVVVGKQGAGKTSLIRRLFGEDITDVTSTNGIEIHKIKCKAMSDDGIWKKLDGKNEENEINARLLKPIEEKLSRDKEMIDTPVASEANKPNKEYANKSKKFGTEKLNLSVKPVGSEPQVESTVATLQLNKVFEKAGKDIKTMAESKVDFKDKEEYATLLLWDFAGDEEFYHTHQTFLSPDAIYLVVTKLNEVDNKEAKEMFQLWMNSIHCYCKLDGQNKNPATNSTESDKSMKEKNNYLDPPVVLVGSHKDQVTPFAGDEDI